MQSIKKITAQVVTAAVFVVGATLVAGTHAHAQETTVLQFNRWLPAGHFVQTSILDPWAQDIEEATEGRVRIEMTASPLGPPARSFDLVRSGAAQVTWSATGYTANRFITGQSVELPFKTTTGEALSVAYWRVHQSHFAKANEYAGVKLLSLHVQPPGELYTTKAELTSPEELSGLKIRIPNPATADLLKTYGGVGVAQPSSRAYELLSNGVIDGTFLTPDAVVQFNLADLINHQLVVEGGFFNAGFFLIMNQKVWDGLSEQDQQAIEELSGESFARRAGKIWDAEAVKSDEILQQRGVIKTTLDGAQTEALKSNMSGMDEAWVEMVEKKNIDGQAALHALQEHVSSYTAQ